MPRTDGWRGSMRSAKAGDWRGTGGTGLGTGGDWRDWRVTSEGNGSGGLGERRQKSTEPAL